MGKTPQISDAEWLVMKVLWVSSPLSANDVFAKLDNSSIWKPSTVKTLLGRLVKKGALAYKTVERTYLYYPIVAEDTCIRAETNSFLQKVYNGSLNLLIANFLQQEKLSKEEIEELKQLLDKEN